MKLWERAKKSKLALLLAALCASAGLGYVHWDKLKGYLPELPDSVKSLLAPAEEAPAEEEAPAKEF